MSNDLEKETQSNNFIRVLMGGYAVWKMTVHCISAKQYYTIDKLIWKELDKRAPFVKEKLDELKANGIDITDWHYENYSYALEMFKV